MKRMRTIREVLNRWVAALAKGEGVNTLGSFDAELDPTFQCDFSASKDVDWRRRWNTARDIYVRAFDHQLPDNLDEPFDRDAMDKEIVRLRAALAEAADIIDSAADVIEDLDGDMDGEGAQARDDAARYRRMSRGEPEPDDDIKSKHFDRWLAKDERRGKSITDAAAANDRVRSYLDSLVWDERPYVAGLASYVARELNAQACDAVERFLLSAVARAYEPGCRVENTLVLVGEQGCGKTTLLCSLFGAQNHLARDLGDGGLTDMHLVWVVEMQACGNLPNREDVKSFLTTKTDRFRPPYARETADYRRAFLPVFVMDEPGYGADLSRRFYVLRMKVLTREAVAWIKAHRDQIWAESVAKYKEQRKVQAEEDAKIDATAERVLAAYHAGEEPAVEDVETMNQAIGLHLCPGKASCDQCQKNEET